MEKKGLARALYKQVDVGSVIPVEQYEVVAEVLRFVYELKFGLIGALIDALTVRLELQDNVTT